MSISIIYTIYLFYLQYYIHRKFEEWDAATTTTSDFTVFTKIPNSLWTEFLTSEKQFELVLEDVGNDKKVMFKRETGT